MKGTVTYLSHSGFLLEWEHCYWLFDYYRGEIPRLTPKKKLFVFCSHSHADHFNPEIFTLAKRHAATEYIFSRELGRACRLWERRHPELKIPPVQFLQGGADEVFDDGQGTFIFVHALPSTDQGAAFLVRYQGKQIYHAGDLHWWIWPGEPEEDNRQMTGRYKKEMEYLKDKELDLAFTPLDPRQEEYYDRGLSYLLGQTLVRQVFPMHFWGNFDVIPRYLEGRTIPQGTKIYEIKEDGQSWEVCI